MDRGPHATGTGAGQLEELLEAERSRVADLLHDGPLSGLLAIRQDLQELADPTLDGTVAALDQVVAQLRGVTRANHADLLAQLPLPGALEVVAGVAAMSTSAAVELDIGHPELLAPYAPLARSAVLELTTNAIRHGRARRIRVVTLRPDAAHVELLVSSDGEPIDLRQVQERGQAGHLGLLRLVRRVAAVGGTVTIGGDAHPAAVKLRLPVSARASGERAVPDVGFHVDPWFVVRADLTYAHVSDAMAALVGYSREAMLATPPDERPWFADRVAAPANRRRITARTIADGSYVTRVTLRHRDGHTIPTVATSHLLTPREDEDEGVPRFLALFRPIPPGTPDGVTGLAG